MPWIAIDAAVAVLGLAVLAVLSLAVWHRARALTREVRTASVRLAAASQRISPPVQPSPGAADG